MLPLVCLLFAAPPAKAPPAAPPPRLVYVKAGEDGQPMVGTYVTETVEETVTKKVQENGKEVEKTETKKVPQRKMIVKTLAAVGGAVTPVDAKAVSADAVTARLKAGAVVLVPADGKAMADVYRAVLAPDALILTLPGVADGVHPLPASAPPARGILFPVPPAAADGVLKLPGVVEKTVKVPKILRFVEDGKIREEKRDIEERVLADEPMTVEQLGGATTTADGGAIDAAAAAAKAKAAGVVLLAVNGEGVDELYRKAFKPDVVVLATAKIAIPDWARVDPSLPKLVPLSAPGSPAGGGGPPRKKDG